MDNLSPARQKAAIKAASYLWMGKTMEQASILTGVPHSTLKNWKAAPWWNDCVREAERLELGKMVGLARQNIETTLRNGVAQDATARERSEANQTAKWVLERRDAQFRPEVHHIHSGGTASPEQLLAELSNDQLRAIIEGRTLEAQVLEVEYEETQAAECPASDEPASGAGTRPALPPGVYEVPEA